MRLVLLRHGNTFEDRQTPVWLGAKDDLPLTLKGREQAEQIGQVLAGQEFKAIYSGPLSRTRETAKIVAQAVSFKRAIVIDQRLIEIDYGLWSGLSDAEVKAKYGSEEFEAWSARGVWPSKACFVPSEAVVKAEIIQFAKELDQKYEDSEQVLVVSSNGKLRYFLALVAGELERRLDCGQFKLGTGKAGIIDLVGNAAKLIGWNIGPDELAAKIGKANEV